MTRDDYAPDTTSITLPEPRKRYRRLQVQVALEARDGDGSLVCQGVRLVSLSASGIGFVPTGTLQEGQRLRLDIDLREPGVSCSVQAEAMVVRVIDDDFELYVGCRFVDFEGGRQQALAAALEAVQRARGEAGG